MDYTTIITDLKHELSTKSAPGPILDEIMFRYLEAFSSEVECNKNLLYVGAILGDIRIDEARADGNKEAHIDYALSYASDVYEKYDIPFSNQEIINEVIATHHGGEQKYVESKIYKNADNFKFLEPRGAFHFFGVLYHEVSPENLNNVVTTVKSKLKSKLELTDWNNDTIAKANDLYAQNIQMLDKIFLELQDEH